MRYTRLAHAEHTPDDGLVEVQPHRWALSFWARAYRRLARPWDIVAAADRMYRERVKGMLHSLRYNAFPITRGGGREALAYSQWLLSKDWSLLIFPEGKRSRTGELLRFHPGPAILALSHDVPVAPIYIRGAIDILPPGHQRSQPAPVHVSIGRPIVFPEGTSVNDARQAMEDAVRSLMTVESDVEQPKSEPVLVPAH